MSHTVSTIEYHASRRSIVDMSHSARFAESGAAFAGIIATAVQRKSAIGLGHPSKELSGLPKQRVKSGSLVAIPASHSVAWLLITTLRSVW